MPMKLNPSDIPEVAIAFMQETHLEEIAMLNALYVLFDKSRAGEEIPELTNQLEAIVAHTHAHFERENEKMVELNFPPYPMHKQVHDEYLNELDDMLETWHKDNDLTPVIVFFEVTTPQWLKQHIATMDFVTANFFAMVEGN